MFVNVLTTIADNFFAFTYFVEKKKDVSISEIIYLFNGNGTMFLVLNIFVIFV